MSSNAIYSKANNPLSVKGTASAHFRVAGGIWKGCTQNHSKSLGYFLIALSCPASAILNATSGLFSIFKPSQQQGIVFPVNIAFWLFIYRLPTHGMPWGRGSSSIAPRSTGRQPGVWLPSRGRDKPFIWDLFCFQLCVGSAVFAGKVGKERGTNHTPPRRQESSTAVCRGRFCPCTSG